jgi:hypothetical protein
MSGSARRGRAAVRAVRAACLAATGAALVPAAAAASDTSGWMIGLDLASSHADFEDRKPSSPPDAVFVEDDGGGVNILAGYGFTRAFALRLDLAGAEHETSDPNTEFLLSSATLEAMAVLRDPHAFRPYLVGGVGGFTARSRRDDFDFDVTGPGVTVGTGFLWFTGRRFALDVALRADFINWDRATATLTLADGSHATVDTPIQEDGAAARFLIGASWWFGRGE